MLQSVSIKSLYGPALAEGEGVGTAYEYFAKRLVLRGWLKNFPQKPKSILMAGCPEKYGSNLDTVLLAAELGATLTIIDDRPEALEKAQAGLKAAQAENWLPKFGATYTAVKTLTDLSELKSSFDLVVVSEVLQRIPVESRMAYITELQQMGTAVALFTPNGDNSAHTNLSGLSGLSLQELSTLVPTWQAGYIDMPPFPPGIVRSEEQREQATTGTFENIVMWGLAYYARCEFLMPTAIRRKQSHIVYALSPT